MTAYLVLMQQVDDVERYRTGYVPGVRPFLERCGAEVPVAGLEAEAAEGEPPNSTVVLQIPDAEVAWGMLDDPDYQPVRDSRHCLTSRGQAVLVPEFAPGPVTA